MCAIFGAISKKPDPELINKLIIGLVKLQHRGEESAGIVYGNSKQVWNHKKYGLISQVFTPEKIEKIKERMPTMIIGQTHYSTSGNKSERNIPPQWVEPRRGRIGIVHNGNIPSLTQKKEALSLEAGNDIRFDEDNVEVMNDSEFMIKYIDWLMSRSDNDVFEAIRKFMTKIPGSYSAALLSRDGVYIFRDRFANRPLFWVENLHAIYFASETCALEGLGGDINDFTPGVVMEILPDGVVGRHETIHPSLCENLAHCVFENIYFSMPDSKTFTSHTDGYFRHLLGRELAVNFPVENADFISSVPESGRAAAQGFALQIQKPFLDVLVRDHYIGRTFIHPNQEERNKLAEFKYRLDKEKEIIGGKVVVLVDDSIVRLTTMKRLVPMLLGAGVREVHVRISAPPTISPCCYGIDMPTKSELIAANKSVEEIRAIIGASSLAYNTMDSLNSVIKKCKREPGNFCNACFTGNYPISIQ
jgi:amidophosphoribosyltransferase